MISTILLISRTEDAKRKRGKEVKSREVSVSINSPPSSSHSQRRGKKLPRSSQGGRGGTGAHSGGKRRLFIKPRFTFNQQLIKDDQDQESGAEDNHDPHQPGVSKQTGHPHLSRSSSSKFTAVALKSLANRFTNKDNPSKARKKPDSLPITFKTRPGTPNRNGHRFLKSNKARVLPVYEAYKSSSIEEPPEPESCVKRALPQGSRTAVLLSSIPTCALQRCLIKYGCGHCL